MEAHPTGGTLADLFRADNENPATVRDYSLGTTSLPVNTVLPLFALQVTVDPVAHGQALRSGLYRRMGIPSPPPPVVARAHYNVTRAAAPGNNVSLYLRGGIYETNFTLGDENIDKSIENWRQRIVGFFTGWEEHPEYPRVYIYMPDDTAALSRAAEQEHLDDMWHAWTLTFGVVANALNATGSGRNEPEARSAAEAAFTSALPVKLRNLGSNMESWKNKFLELCVKTRDRDIRGDHSMGLELVAREDVPAPDNVTYLTGGPRDENGRVYLRVYRGTARVPGLLTNTLIDY